MDEVKGPREGEEETRRQRAARAGLRSWGQGGKNWRREAWGRDPGRGNILRKRGRTEKFI